MSADEIVTGTAMSRLDARFAVHRERLRLAALLDELAPDEWEQASLCAGWRVRDVVAHLVQGPQSTFGGMTIEFARARGDLHQVVREAARRKATEPTARLVGELRAAADSDRRTPFTSYVDPLVDVLVHDQDIVVPLHRRLDMPVRDAAAAATRVWQLRFFAARKRLRGIRFEATDVRWARGSGRLVAGPIESILLVLSGRAVGLTRLDGPGQAALAERLGGLPPR